MCFGKRNKFSKFETANSFFRKRDAIYKDLSSSNRKLSKEELADIENRQLYLILMNI